MSATMQQGVAALLVRKTEEGRAKARRSIEAWQGTISAVHQSEKMAECKINLASNHIQGPQQAAAQVDTAKYVLAVYLDKKAATERTAVITTATKALQEGIKQLQGLETIAKQELQTAINEHDRAVAAAEKARQHDIDTWVSRTRLKGQIRLIVGALVGAVLGIVVVKHTATFHNTITNYGITDDVADVVTYWFKMLFGWFGWFALPILLHVAAYRSHVGSVEATYRKAAKAAKNRLREVRPPREESIRHAEAQMKKYEDALRRFQAHV